MERHNAAQFTVSRSEVHSSSMAQRGACFCRALGRTTEVTNCVYQWGVRESRHKGSDEAELQQRRGGGGNTLGFALLKARREEKKWPVPEPRGAPVPTLSDRCGWHLRGTTTTESPPPLPCCRAPSRPLIGYPQICLKTDICGTGLWGTVKPDTVEVESAPCRGGLGTFGCVIRTSMVPFPRVTVMGTSPNCCF